MIETLKNAWKTPELRKKIIFTLVCLLIFRLGSIIPVPFINKEALAQLFTQLENTVLGFFNTMSGGSFSAATIFALSIQPYINASIIMQLLAVAIPALERMVKEGGEDGKKKLAAITRYATVALGFLQGFAYYSMLNASKAIDFSGINRGIVATIIIITFTAGTAFIMWLGEQITEHGVGNGISIILFAGIVSRFPQIAESVVGSFRAGSLNIWEFALIAIIVLAVVAFVVFMNDAERRIPVQYAKRMVGNKMYGGRSTHLPIKVNMSGVLPIIFAASFATFPATIAAFFGNSVKNAHGSFWHIVIEHILAPNSIPYAVIYFALIIFFSFFYTSVQVNPVEISNNIKNNGGTIPGIRPGRPTSDFIGRIVRKVTFFGSLFLGIIAVLPIISGSITGVTGMALGGTSLLIIVGVALETVKQLESQIMMRNYKGFLE